MEHLPRFDLHRPSTVAEAVALRAGAPKAKWLAGGTDMIVNVRRGIETPEALIDLAAIDGLARIAADGDGLRIGAGAGLREVAEHPRVRRDYPAVAEAAARVAGPTHRQYGTIGGNLCLDTRCLYYNQSQWWRESNDFCLKHLGSVCHVAPGGKRCFAAFSGDVAPALLVHGAEIDLAGPSGERSLPLGRLYRDDGMDHLALADGELVTSIRLPPAAGARSGYEKSRIRGSIDFPLAGVAVRLRLDEGRIADLGVALTGVAPWPFMVRGLGDLEGGPPGEDVLDALRDRVRAQAKPMGTTTVKPWYRRRVAGALARKLARRLAAA